MSTSGKIGAALGIVDVPINYNYCEFLATFLYATESPMPKLSLRTMDLETLKREKNLEHINFTDDEAGYAHAATLYPESHESGVGRITQNIET